MVMDLALKSPGEKYRYLLRQAIEKSGKTQARVALDAEVEPANLANMLAGRRKPFIDYQKNLALAKACEQSEDLARELQSEAEAFFAIGSQPRAFRRYMAVMIRVVESLIEKMEGEIEDMQVKIGGNEESGEDQSEVEIYMPESLLAISKIIESLRYWWPVEPGEDWQDYPGIGGSIRRRLSKLSPEKRVNALVDMEVEEALQWVEAQGDLDPFIEKRELVRRLAEFMDIKEELLAGIISSLDELANEGNRPRKGRSIRVFYNRQNESEDDR
jgi:hypothetical protein